MLVYAWAIEQEQDSRRSVVDIFVAEQVLSERKCSQILRCWPFARY